MKRKLRASLRDNQRSPEGVRVFAIGARVGYWPCVKGLFVSATLGFKTLEIWHGLPATSQRTVDTPVKI